MCSDFFERYYLPLNVKFQTNFFYFCICKVLKASSTLVWHFYWVVAPNVYALLSASTCFRSFFELRSHEINNAEKFNRSLQLKWRTMQNDLQMFEVHFLLFFAKFKKKEGEIFCWTRSYTVPESFQNIFTRSLFACVYVIEIVQKWFVGAFVVFDVAWADVVHSQVHLWNYEGIHDKNAYLNAFKVC